MSLFADGLAPLEAALKKQSEHKSVVVSFRQTKSKQSSTMAKRSSFSMNSKKQANVSLQTIKR